MGLVPVLVPTPPPAVRNSPGVEAIREGFPEEMTVHGCQRIKWPKKSVKSIPGRGWKHAIAPRLGYQQRTVS